MISGNFAALCRGAIIGRMRSECARDLTDAEIHRTLDGCVCGNRLTAAAKHLREIGQLNPLDLCGPTQ